MAQYEARRVRGRAARDVQLTVEFDALGCEPMPDRRIGIVADGSVRLRSVRHFGAGRCCTGAVTRTVPTVARLVDRVGTEARILA